MLLVLATTYLVTLTKCEAGKSKPPQRSISHLTASLGYVMAPWMKSWDMQMSDDEALKNAIPEAILKKKTSTTKLLIASFRNFRTSQMQKENETENSN